MKHTTTSSLHLTRSTFLACVAGIFVLMSMSPAYFGDFPYSNYGWRVAMAVLLISVWMRFGIALDTIVLKWFAPWIIAITMVAVVHHQHEAVWSNLARHVIIVFYAASISHAIKGDLHYGVIRTFLSIIFYGALVLCSFAAATLLIEGWSWNLGRIAKRNFLEGGGLLFNAALFVICIGIVCVPPVRRWGNLAVLALFLLLSVVLTTRTPVFTLICAVAFSFAFRSVVYRKGRRNRLSAWAISSIVIVAPLLGVWYVLHDFDPALSRALSGRAQLWQAAIAHWESALFAGNPALSVRDSVGLSYDQMTFSKAWEFSALYNLNSGGYHSVWLQAAAFGGIIAFVGLWMAYWNLIVAGLLTRRSAKLLIIVLLLLGRSFVEFSGLFAQANAPLDLVAITALVFTLRERPRTSRPFHTVQTQAHRNRRKTQTSFINNEKMA